jgi:hypothetical protein
MEVAMNRNIRLAQRDTLMARIWQRLVNLDEAIGASPLEHLEGRVAALEQKVRGSDGPLANRNQKPPNKKQ